MPEPCKYHEAIKDELKDKVSKSSIKWVATIFSVPAVISVLVIYSFIQSADFRYGSAKETQAAQANIKMLDERTMTLKGEMVKLQADISSDLNSIKLELKEISKELRTHSPKSRDHER